MKRNRLLLVLVFGLALNACKDYDGIEVIIVNKIPRGAFADEELPEKFKGIGWYEIGLSRNGKEPIEYIWRADKGPEHWSIMHAKIGEKGTIYISHYGKQYKMKLPRPNARKPPVISALGEAHWIKSKGTGQHTGSRQD